MMNAKIVKNDTPAIRLIELTTPEKSRLAKAITGYGKLAAAVSSTGIDQNTIKRAIAGFKIKPDTAAALRSFINPQ